MPKHRRRSRKQRRKISEIKKGISDNTDEVAKSNLGVADNFIINNKKRIRMIFNSLCSKTKI